MKRYDNRTAFWLPIVICLLLSGGCASIMSLEKPQITLADIQVREIKTLETSFIVQLRIMNPNPTPLDIEGLSCDVELDGRKFASGVQGSQETIPAYGSALVPMEVYGSVLDMVSSVLGVIKSQNEPGSAGKPVNYRLTGKVRVKSGTFARNLPFASKGELKL